ncbi:MAG: hypothetical protein LBD71_06100 [Treponema sp.]|jgi:hypothetical protein|nr:hypothetical protein [Treponema sp.]
MKKPVVLFCSLFLAAVALNAQNSFNGINFGGATGLYSIPTGRIGWERSANVGLDFGYHAIINNHDYRPNRGNEWGIAGIGNVTASLFKWMELSFAFDIQPNFSYWVPAGPGGFNEFKAQKNNDFILGYKVQLPTNIKNPDFPAIALGGNVQFNNAGDYDWFSYTALQFYAAATYSSAFFTMPAETTLVIGKTFTIDAQTRFGANIANNSDIDFGMGFDLILLPDILRNYIHWIIDYSNFGYGANSWPNTVSPETSSPWYRGILNTGIRVDLAMIPALSKFKFIVDLTLNDLFDHDSRAFAVGLVFGLPVVK